TVVDVPAAFWKSWLDSFDEAGTELDEPGGEPPESLRLTIAGGESVGAEQVERWVERTGGAFFGPYGPTEATVCTTGFLTGDGWRERCATPRLPIGRPLDHVAVHLVDRHFAPVPPGAAGELLVGGQALARGYLGRPASTAERFVPDPFSEVPGGRLYRTGDLARWLPGGEIEFAGRVDDQIKIRGFRIEPGEVEAHLRQHPAVAEAAVVARDDGAARRLVAFLEAPSGGAAPSPGELAGFLASRLPAYMVPSAFVVLDALPVTANGKVDRRALPEVVEAAPSGPKVAPRNDAEQVLAEVWARVLGQEEIGVHDNFFQLGGDSILSIRIVAQAAQAGLALAPRQLFEHQTVAELAAVAGRSAVAAEQGPVGGVWPLTPVQRWFLDRGLDHPEHWNQSLLLAVPPVAEAADVAAWRGAVAAVVEHHDALRLRFACGDDGSWSARAAAPEPALLAAPFTQVDLSALPSEVRAEVRGRAAAAAQASFDLARGPLLRVVLFSHHDGGDDRLLLAAHHLAVDAVSWGPLLEDLETARRATAAGEPPRLPAKTTSYKAWGQRLAEWAASGEPERELDLWVDRTAAPLPRDGDGSGDGDGRGNRVADADTVRRAVDAERTAALAEGVVDTFGANLEEALLAALADTFHAWTGSRRLAVNVESHGRHAEGFADVDLSRTVGWFTAAFPLVVERPADGDPGEVVKEAKERRRAARLQGLGYGVLRHLSPAGGELAQLPAPEVSFNYLGRTDALASGGGEDGEGGWKVVTEEPLGPLHAESDERAFAFEIDAAVEGGRLRVTWTYGRRLHRRETVERLADGLVDALGRIAERCGSGREFTPSDFPEAALDSEGLDQVMSLLDQLGEN
ncbi:MAG TPA: condensation domain-containing protein, partial [Thermoanaerobaculia bacterium]|nr:condensation domain-containing protein [Thermoanaerobaculia bacterium]